MTRVSIRPAAISGTFYPARPAALRETIAGALTRARATGISSRYLIVPHAGYVYSGDVAAAAYQAIRQPVERVLVLGPTHRVWVQGMAVPAADAFATPLGDVPLDRAACDALAARPDVEVNDLAHRDEHCIEVHLPFLQATIGAFKLIPVLVGGASARAVADVIESADDGRTLVLVSSDLSHFHDYRTATDIDARTAARILALEENLAGEEACGAAAINGLLHYARARGLAAEALDMRNSGDTAGPRDRVVGYGSFALREAA